MINKSKIQEFNPWIIDSAFRFEEKDFKKRFIYSQIEESLKLRLIVSISGLRRIGKTTILKQLINSSLDAGKKVFYYQFSDTDSNIAQVLETAFDYVLNEPAHKASALLFLDELHFTKNWQDTLKYYYDLNKNLQFIITGSSSLYVQKDTKESMAGRILDFNPGVLSFKEYLYLKNTHTTNSLESEDVIDASGKPADIYTQLKDQQKYTDSQKGAVWDYLIQGEFAETINFPNYEFVRKYLTESVMEKIFSKDIKVFEIEKIEEIQKLHRALLQSSGQTFSVLNLATDLGIQRPTVNKYINILQKAYLVDIRKNYLRSFRTQEKSFDKVYSTSLNLLSAVMGISDYRNYRYVDFFGHVVENYVLNKLLRIFTNAEDMYFYNEKKKEVDFVVVCGQNVLPFEVKTKDDLKTGDLKPLIDFMDRKKLREGFVFYGGDNKIINFGHDTKGKRIYALNWI